MTYRLRVSHDCGIHYEEEARSENPEDFAPRIAECERDWLRWVIEDDRDNITHISGIHRGILDALHTANPGGEGRVPSERK